MKKSTPPAQASYRLARTCLVLPFQTRDETDDLKALRTALSCGTLKNLADFLSVGVRDELAENSVWQPARPLLQARYFYPFLHRIFGESDDSHAHSIELALPSLELTPDAINLLSGRDGARGPGWFARVSARAVERLRQAGFDTPTIGVGNGAPADRFPGLQFDVASVRVLFFGTGVGMLLIELSFARAGGSQHDLVPVEYILEINQVIARADRTKGKPAVFLHAQPDSRPGPRKESSDVCDYSAGCDLPGLGILARFLLGLDSTELAISTPNWQKAFTYTAMALDGSLSDDERDRLAVRLARKETTDYESSLCATHTLLSHPFEPLTHAVSLEGGASIVVADGGSDDSPEFLRQFVNQTAWNTYLPIALWAYHDYLVLVRFTLLTQGWIDFRHPDKQSIEQLRQFRNRIYNYRFHYRFTHASMISMHNELADRWALAFGLRSMLTDVAQDVAEAENYLESVERDAYERRQTRRDRTLTVLIFYIGILLAMPDWTGVNLTEAFPAVFIEQPWRARIPYFQLAIVGLGVVSLMVWHWFSRE